MGWWLWHFETLQAYTVRVYVRAASNVYFGGSRVVVFTQKSKLSDCPPRLRSSSQPWYSRPASADAFRLPYRLHECLTDVSTNKAAGQGSFHSVAVKMRRASTCKCELNILSTREKSLFERPLALASTTVALWHCWLEKVCGHLEQVHRKTQGYPAASEPPLIYRWCRENAPWQATTKRVRVPTDVVHTPLQGPWEQNIQRDIRRGIYRQQVIPTYKVCSLGELTLLLSIWMKEELIKLCIIPRSIREQRG